MKKNIFSMSIDCFIKNFLAILLLYSILPFHINAQAQSVEDQLNRQRNSIMRTQQHNLDESKRKKQAEAVKKDRDQKRKARLQREKVKEMSAGSSALKECSKIKEISITGSHLISRRVHKKLFSEFIGGCIDNSSFSNIYNKLNKYYQDKGFITAQIIIPQQSIKDGTIKVEVIEGVINKIIIKNQGFGKTDKNSAKSKNSIFNRLKNNTQKLTAFGNIEGKNLNINDINQGVYQINRLTTSEAVMKIIPGQEVGESDLEVSNKRINKRKYQVASTYNNTSQEFTGTRSAALAATSDNLLFLNEQMMLMYLTNVDDDSGEKEIKALVGNITIPFGYYTLGFDYSSATFLGIIEGVSSDLKLTGFSDSNNVSLDRLVFNSEKLRINADMSLTSKKTATYLNYNKIENTERKLVIGNLSTTISYQPHYSTNIYLKPMYSRGLKSFNATKDDGDAASDVSKAQYEKYSLRAIVTKSFDTKIPFSIATDMTGQIAKDALFGSEQISIGGESSVRGYRENFLTGDSGYYFRNYAKVNLKRLLPKKWFSDVGYHRYISRNLQHLSKITFQPFFDYGYVSDRANNNSGRLSGAGLKTSFVSKYFNADLTYSKSINKSQLLSGLRKEKRLIYFNIIAGFK